MSTTNRGAPALILLNGMPAAGKSTLAARLVQLRPMALNLDIDAIRHQIGHWLGRPTEAGLAARGLARAMAERHLQGGFDVVVPQYLGQPGFIGELEEMTVGVDGSFHHLLLDVPLEQAVSAFERRSAESTDPIHNDAARLVDQSSLLDPLARYDELLRDLPATHRPHRTVPVTDGDVDHTLDLILVALQQLGLDWSNTP